jgi:hypothetical protein
MWHTPQPRGIDPEARLWFNGNMSNTATHAATDILDAMATKLTDFLASGERCRRTEWEVGVEDHGVCRVCTLPGICHEV